MQIIDIAHLLLRDEIDKVLDAMASPAKEEFVRVNTRHYIE